jgi:PIN domain nuclease of toxin-antitoxin system
LILLDTHAAFWLNAAPQKLSKSAARAIARAKGSSGLGLASISLWELARLVEKERLRLKDVTTREFLRAFMATKELRLLELDAEIALVAAQLPPDFPADPADRIIAATARVHGVPLVTKDLALLASPLVTTIW